MRKSITLRYAQKCKVCSETIPAGARATWLGSGQGVSHETCKTESPGKPLESERESRKWTVPFTEIRNTFRALVDSGDASYFKRGENRSKASSLSERWKSGDDWFGCTVGDMKMWLESGYTVPGLAGIDPSLIHGKPRRRIRFSEEGDEMLIDLVMSGVDEHMLTVERRPGKPGLRVEIMLSFSAMVNAELVAAYSRFCARMLQTFDEHHIDVEIDLINRVNGLAGSGLYSTGIRVKDAGFASDISSWSAMFSPGGFRMLMFLAMIGNADRNGENVSYGLGIPVTETFDIRYDELTNTLQVTQSNGGSFPEAEMTEKLAAVIEKLAS